MGKWRQGHSIQINVYEDERPVCQCHTVTDAKVIVDAMNNSQEQEHDAAIREAALREAIATVDDCRMIAASPIGPLHSAGWNDAIKAVKQQLALLDKPAEPPREGGK